MKRRKKLRLRNTSLLIFNEIKRQKAVKSELAKTLKVERQIFTSWEKSLDIPKFYLGSLRRLLDIPKRKFLSALQADLEG